jgi:hypothetical protein
MIFTQFIFLHFCIRTVKPKNYMSYKGMVPSSQETKRLSNTKVGQLTLLRDMITVYYENHKEHTNTLCGQTAEDFSLKTLDS